MPSLKGFPLQLQYLSDSNFILSSFYEKKNCQRISLTYIYRVQELKENKVLTVGENQICS